MAQQQAIRPEVEIIARALRRKNSADEVLRLIEHLPDKDALELLEKTNEYVSKPHWLSNVLSIMLYFLGTGIIVFRQNINFVTDIFIYIAFSLLIILKCLNMYSIYRNEFFISGKTLRSVVLRLNENINSSNAVDPLLRFAAYFKITQVNNSLVCWKKALSLLPKMSDDEAKALSPTARNFLIDLINGTNSDAHNLSERNRLAAILVLSPVKDAQTKKIIEKQRKSPIQSIREMAEHILEGW
jgi:hypothetical protein